MRNTELFESLVERESVEHSHWVDEVHAVVVGLLSVQTNELSLQDLNFTGDVYPNLVGLSLTMESLDSDTDRPSDVMSLDEAFPTPFKLDINDPSSLCLIDVLKWIRVNRGIDLLFLRGL